jgi:hypothetical protein
MFICVSGQQSQFSLQIRIANGWCDRKKMVQRRMPSFVKRIGVKKTHPNNTWVSQKTKSAACLSAHLICRVFDLAGRLDRFENVDMSTNIEHIWLFLAGGRPGTKFYVVSPIRNLNTLSSPRIKNLIISPFQWESLHKILYQAFDMLNKSQISSNDDMLTFSNLSCIPAKTKLTYDSHLIYFIPPKQQQTSRQIWQ